MSETTASPRKGFTRRTLVKGAAWSVPVVAVASSVPAYAKSGGPPRVTIQSACKQPGDSCKPEFTKGYTFTYRVDNPTDKTVYLYLPSSGTYRPYFQYTSGVTFTFEDAREYFPGTPATLGNLVNPLALAPGQTRYIAVQGGGTGNSGNTFAVGTLWFAWGHTSTAGADPDHPYTPSPWANPQVTPFGTGWTGGPFAIGSPANKEFPPCDKKNNCIP